MQRKQNDENIIINDETDIKFCIEKLEKGITMKGALLSFAMIHGDKHIENRPRKIPVGWLALHTGSGKISKEFENWAQINLEKIMEKDEIPKEKDLPHSAVIGAIHINNCLSFEDNQNNLKDNKWAIGNYCGIIDRKIIFKDPVFTLGHIATSWSFESADKRNKKFNKYEGKLKEKIQKQLQLLLK